MYVEYSCRWGRDHFFLLFSFSFFFSTGEWSVISGSAVIYMYVTVILTCIVIGTCTYIHVMTGCSQITCTYMEFLR